MLNLKQNLLRIAFSLLFVIIVSTEINAQFDSIIFARNDIYRPESVVYLGDQDNDGYDDFVLCTFYEINGYNGKALLFYGGNPINPVPAMSFDIYSSAGYGITACDYNRDGYRDIIITNYNSQPLIFKLYLGGPNIDTIPDLVFSIADNTSSGLQLFGSDWPVDMNGDGFEELLVYSNYSNGQKGSFFVYNSSEVMDSLPDAELTYAPDEKINFNNISAGDLDGDGRTDLTFKIEKPSIPMNFGLRRFVFGRSDFSFLAVTEFMDSSSIVGWNRIIQDINKDGKAELVFYDTKFTYPYWYQLAISYGSRHLNYIPEEGLNTQNEGWYHTRSIGDVNGDGYGDFLTSLNYYGGRLFVGGKHRPDDTPVRYYPGPTNILARVGDVNGDGLDDIGIGTHGEPGAAQGTFYIMSGERVAMAIEDDEVENGEKEEITLKAYPNPTRGEITVEITGNYTGYAELRLFNTTGKELIRKEIEVTTGITTGKIDFRELNISSGVYIVDMLFKSTESETTERDYMNLNGKKKSVKIVLIK